MTKKKSQPPKSDYHFTANTEELLDLLRTVEPAIDNAVMHPILKLRMLRLVEGGEIFLTGFNLETSIQCGLLPLDWGKPFSICVPKLFLDVVSKLKSETVSVSIVFENEGSIDIVTSSNSGTYHVQGSSADDYPSLDFIDSATITALIPESFCEITKAALACAADPKTSTFQPILTGVNVRMIDGLVYAIASNGSIGAFAFCEGAIGWEDFPSVSIPQAAIELIQNSQPHTMRCQIDKDGQGHMISFTGANTVIVSRLYQGEYPNLIPIFPILFRIESTLVRKDLIGAIERLSLVGEEYVTIGFEEEGVSLVAQRSGSKISHDLLPATSRGSHEIRNAVKISHFLSVLRSIDVQEIVLAVSAEANKGNPEAFTFAIWGASGGSHKIMAVPAMNQRVVT